jgi:hypothetical protein
MLVIVKREVTVTSTQLNHQRYKLTQVNHQINQNHKEKNQKNQNQLKKEREKVEKKALNEL